MAIIKTLKDEELVGGHSNTKVYPITHTDAIYDSANRKLAELITTYDKNITDTSALGNKHDALKAAFEQLKLAFDTLIGEGDVDTVINTFREVEAFLAEYKSDSTLSEVINGFLGPIRESILALDTITSMSLNSTTGELSVTTNSLTSTLSNDSKINPETGEVELVFNV